MDVAVIGASKDSEFSMSFWVFYYLVVVPIGIFLFFQFMTESQRPLVIRQPQVIRQPPLIQRIDLTSDLERAKEWMIIDKLVDEWNQIIVSKNLQHPIINKQELRQSQMSFGEIKSHLLQNIKAIKDYLRTVETNPTTIYQIEKRKHQEFIDRIFADARRGIYR